MLRWLKIEENRQITGLIGSGAAVLVFAAWALFVHFSKPDSPAPFTIRSPTPVLNVQATYTVCRAGSRTSCPIDALWLGCDDQIPEWAKKECASYAISTSLQQDGGAWGWPSCR